MAISTDKVTGTPIVVDTIFDKSKKENSKKDEGKNSKNNKNNKSDLHGKKLDESI